MADILQKEQTLKTGVRKSKNKSLRVDLSPMVDLGFLLISFFVFTTTIAQPKARKLVLPDDKNIANPLKAAANKTLNLVLGANNKVFAYNGSDISHIKNIGSDSKSIRNTILSKKTSIRNTYGSDSGMIVLIKPTDQSTYKNVLNTLDEMLICQIKTYILVDADSTEAAALR